MTRAKFKCVSLTKKENWKKSEEHPYLYDADFSAVMDGSEENKSFWEATPSGSVKLSTIRADHFQVGKFYYLDFSEAAQ